MHHTQAPETKNALTPVFEFNLMFATQIGPTGLLKGYMRPEARHHLPPPRPSARIPRPDLACAAASL